MNPLLVGVLSTLLLQNIFASDSLKIENLTHTTTIAMSPQPSANNRIKGRLIGYLPGWKTPPPVSALATSGYTHIIVAFGVFSTKKPGMIVPAFDTVSKEYIRSLKVAGIKVLLSLGGPSTSIPKTSINFHYVLKKASSSTQFHNVFIHSLEDLIKNYGFDGFDIDIEKGFNVEEKGTFSKPTGDIRVLANIINTLHKKYPQLLISLVPQVENIAATPSFDATWGNYAALIMQTHHSLSWVGMQFYNSGCVYGLDKLCYEPKKIHSPDFSVAIVSDVLTDWPATASGNYPTGFQSYISYLNPSQIVLGYLVPNAEDDQPILPFTTIKRAMNCLETAVVGPNSCDNYLPPKPYFNIGGMFAWEVTFDYHNRFEFAKNLKDCAINGVCN